MNNLLKSPMLWFLVIGGLIFAIDALVNNSRGSIVVDDRVLMRISALWEQQMNRPPTKAELESLAGNWVNDEMLFREAKRLRLDEEDVIVKRRLIQKMQFIAEEGEVAEPDEAALRAYFEANAEEYRLPVRFTFSHVFFSGEPDAAAIAKVSGSKGNEWRSQGDPTMQRPTWVQRSQRQLAAEFGAGFAESLMQLAPADAWQGPLQSEFGWHLVRLDAVDAAALPRFETVVNQVLNDYLFEAKSEARQNQLGKLRERYEVIWDAQ